MFLFRKPNRQRIRSFISSQADLEFSYASVGMTTDATGPEGFVVDHNRIRLGTGRADFAAARSALCQWRQFHFDWLEINSPDSKPKPGQTVGVLANAAGLWVLNACRVVYVIDEEQPLCRFAVAYGTLPDHAESGEERFQVEWHSEDDSVWYDILAMSRPQQVLTRLAYPYVRYKQKQFARDSARAMQTAVNEGNCP